MGTIIHNAGLYGAVSTNIIGWQLQIGIVDSSSELDAESLLLEYDFLNYANIHLEAINLLGVV